MRRGILVLSTFFSVFPLRADAVTNRSVQIALSAGAGVSSSSEEYGGYMRLTGAAVAGGGEVIGALVGPVRVLLDVSYFRFGRGAPIGKWTWIAPTMEPSHAITAMVGLRLTKHDASQPAPFVSGLVGLGRIAIGDMEEYSSLGLTTTVRSKSAISPAVALEYGVRTPSSSSGTYGFFSLRLVSILRKDKPKNIVPFTVGVAF